MYVQLDLYTFFCDFQWKYTDGLIAAECLASFDAKPRISHGLGLSGALSQLAEAGWQIRENRVYCPYHRTHTKGTDDESEAQPQD